LPHQQGFASRDLTLLCVLHLCSAAVPVLTPTAAWDWPWCQLSGLTASAQLKVAALDFSPAGFQPSLACFSQKKNKKIKKKMDPKEGK